MKARTRVWLVFSLVGGISLGVLALVALRVVDPCGEVLRATATSVDGKASAAILIRNCGATTDYVTHVNIRPSAVGFPASSDAGVRDGEVLAIDGEERLQLEWTTTALIIKHPGNLQGRQFLRTDAWEGYRIQLVATEP